MKGLSAFMLCLSFLIGKTQVLLHFNLIDGGDSCFLAGNFNKWNPSDTAYRFSNNGRLTIAVAAGNTIQYKITRGSWTAVECDANGKDIANRTLSVFHDTTIGVLVEGWKDQFANAAINHTATERVSILDTFFQVKSLKRERTIRVYLPKDYTTTTKYYPVLYMHDGQNLFDDATSFSGEWKIDETIDHVFDSCGRSMIVVAIDNGAGNRLQEYNPYDHPQFGKGEGRQYVSFIVNQLKPFIDSSFRTLPDKMNTAVAGSSMGGLISMYALLAYPAVFGSAGIFSPAFWVAPSIYKLAADKMKALDNHNVFFYAGGKESAGMVPDMQKMYQTLLGNKKINSQLVLDEKAQHNEQAWAVYFPQYYHWLLQQQRVKRDR